MLFSNPLLKRTNIPADYGKMPDDYDFSTKNTDWNEYKNDYVLRTDAVWEKEALTDWFRCYTKCFFFDTDTKQYKIFEPEDMYSIIYEGWALEDIQKFQGITPTGRTNSFQVSLPPAQRTQVPAQAYYHMQDYYMLCALRFEKFFRCDQVYWTDRTTKYDEVLDQSKFKTYPCFRSYYESLQACDDGMFEYLLELAYQKRANETFEEDYANHEIQILPTVYDSPKRSERNSLTY